MFKTKNIYVSSLKNSMAKLFTATSVQQGCSETMAQTSQTESMKEVHRILSSAFQVSVFSSGVSRAKQRDQCLGLALPLWHSFKGLCSTD